MTNKQLIKRWKGLSIKFNSEKIPKPMTDMFLVCCGETTLNVGGGEEKVIIFYQGYDEKGSPAVFFKSDKKDNCFTFGLDTKKNTHIKSYIGRFIKNE